ncbi:outer membrane receptor for ferrienterochelin and colicins [Belliella baltica DSM 15883]|uniref:Outer membrane receptor for ferrienterochelin and colicins n=1 Tax=Belliella baltica (strain DSM 15883 / CIP 108006 / LMG 21964 / BA134) TaxID=866536 RepID=I3Z4H6_BELBD|nr:TonB-dependent receptor [Belliella baltica]AFL84144.1 outer membrane receptor for ferrienterochelin and colicins [Belliella baltica DSM 15883]
MKTILPHLLLSLLLLSTLPLTAQEISIRGKVIEAETSNPLEFANIALLAESDSALVTGVVSELDGTFSFTTTAGDYILRVGFIGYESRFKNISLGDKTEENVGNVRLRKDAQSLDEVVVEGVTSMFESDIDKRRYNVENSIVAEGATASELLSTLPSIQMDDEGSISMRGSGNILIYINGRPSNLSGDDAESVLAQFPANSIKTVELITNPSSRYDAAGVGGIIDIILKKNEKTGLNGQVNASIGTRDKYNAGLNMNYGTEKANYYMSYNFQDRRRFRESESFRESNLTGVSPILDQDSYQLNRDINHLIRGGIDWRLTENQTFGVYAQGNFRDRSGSELLNQRNINSSQELDSLFVRDIDETRVSTNFESGINYSIELDTLGQRLFTSASFSRDERSQEEIYNQTFFNQNSQEVPSNRILQLNDRPQTSNLYVFQLDYEKPFLNGGSLETGLKGTFGKWNRSQNFSEGNEENDFNPVLNDFFSDGFNFKEDVYASYLSYRNKIGKLGYQGGLRAEYTETISRLESTQEPFVNNYFNLFPSAYLSYEIKPEEEFTANFSRRISRPNIWALAPIYRVGDLYNLSIGNQRLQPEFTNSYEVGYMKGWENYLLNATVYHRYSTDVETRVIRLNEDNVAVQMRENANSRASTGFELINQIQVTQWFDATLSGNFFYSEIQGDNIESGFNNSNFSWTLNLLANMAIPKFATLQIQGDYRGPIVLPQGEIEPLWGVNLGLRKDILDNKATISLNVSDIFNTRIFKIRIEDQRFTQDRLFNRETRIGTLSFTYRFEGFKEKRSGEERERDGFEDDDF